MPISFPGLFGDWEFNPDPVAIHIGHGIYWYGIILAFAMLAGLFLAMKQAKRYGLTEDNVMDMVLWAVPSCIIGARLYYVLFYLDLYRDADGSLDWGRMVAVWDGGLAIYGAVIAGVIVAFFFTRHQKLPFFAMTDLGACGLLLGQIIGRWANFINREAFGSVTDLPWRMRLWVSSYQYVEVHPTFLYESLWNLVGLLLLLFVVSRGRRFDGENTCFYFLWYGLGRFWIEGLRTDSLYLFDWTFMGQPIRVSQALSLVVAAAAAVALVYALAIKKCSARNLWVNRLEQQRLLAAEAAQQAAAGAADPLEEGLPDLTGFRIRQDEAPGDEGERLEKFWETESADTKPLQEAGPGDGPNEADPAAGQPSQEKKKDPGEAPAQQEDTADGRAD